MIGKKIRVSELEFKYGTRASNIKAYACFKDEKFNTNIIIYSFEGDNNFYYGNAHVKDNKIIIMKLSLDKDELVLKFIDNLLEDKLEGYEIVDIQNKESVEIISFNELKIDNDKLIKLEEKTIKVEEVVEEQKTKKKGNLKLILLFLLIFIIMIIGGYVYFNMDKIFIKNTRYQCVLTYEHEELNTKVEEIRTMEFTNNNLIKMDVVVDFKFEDMADYQEVKFNNKEYEYSVYDEGSYKYVDDEMKLRMFYNDFTDNDLKATKSEGIIEHYRIKGYECSELKIETE